MTCTGQQAASTRFSYRSSIDSTVRFAYECKADLVKHFSAPPKFRTTAVTPGWIEIEV
jgi:hypothetical protein